VSEKGEKVEIDRLDTVVDMSACSLAITWRSALSMTNVWFVEPQGEEPVGDIVLCDPLNIVTGNCVDW
jgi:hypothetical protein